MKRSISPAREIAMKALVEVMENRAKPENELNRLASGYKDLKKVDRAFAKEALFGTLRWYKKIFWILQHASNRDLKESPPEIRAALLVGTYQIFYMSKVPDRAAVNESVEFVKITGHSRASSFANGILRQIARKSEYYAKPDKKEKPVEYLALQHSHPEWMTSRWFRRFRFDGTEKILVSNNKPPPYTVRMNSLKTDLDEIQELQTALLRDERTQSSRTALRGCLHLKSAPDTSEDSLFGKGLYTIQDEASQLIGLLVNPLEGEVVVDACCGPGGKLSHLYELSKGKATILGVEKSEFQLKRVEENLERLGHTGIELIHADYFDFEPPTAPDKILLDAPCTGLGVLRRHPDGKWHKDPKSVQRLADQQKQMIENSIEALGPGGSLVYSVCSFEEEETTSHLKWAQKRFGDKIEVISPVARLPDFYKRYVTRDNVLLLFSGNQSETDGFGAFIIEKK